jgi:hypothetical protein
MAYDNVRSYIGPIAIAAQNIIATASGQIVAGATVSAQIPIAEPTFLVSLAAVVGATPTTPPAGVKLFAVIGSGTSTGQATPAPAGTLAQATGSSAYNTFIPAVAIPGGSFITVGLVATGTASATETAGAISFIVGLAPQYV